MKKRKKIKKGEGFCPKCGSVIDLRNDVFCMSCGYRFRKQKKKKARWWLVILLIIIIYIIIRLIMKKPIIPDLGFVRNLTAGKG